MVKDTNNHFIKGSKNTIVCRNIKYSKNFTIISRNIVSGNYPVDMLSGHEITRYMHLLYRSHIKTGLTIAGRKDYCSVAGYINAKVFKNTNSYLEDLNFIKIVAKSKTITSTRVVLPPLYDNKKHEIVSYSQKPFTGRNLRRTKQHFIAIPNDLIELEKVLDHRKFNTEDIYVILKLYRYNFLKTFGGVDFNLIRKENNDFIIHEKLYKDIYITKDRLLKILNSLEDKGLIKWIDIVIAKENIEFEEILRYIGDYEDLKSTKFKNNQVISIVRPIYQTKIA